MAFLHHYLIFLCSLFLTSTSLPPQPQPIPRRPSPKSFAVPVRQDPNTGLPIATLFPRNPIVSVNLLLDLNARFVAVNCDADGIYRSTTYVAPLCNSVQCSRVSPPGPSRVCKNCTSSGRPRPGCNNGSCGVIVSNPVARHSAIGELAQERITLHVLTTVRIDGFDRVPRFLFVCAPPELFNPAGGFPRVAVGVAGLGSFQESLPDQVAAQFDLGLRFSVCLPRGDEIIGSVVIGEGPYNDAVVRSLAFTPLSVSHEGEYFISPQGIRINHKVVHTYVTRARISTTARYSVLEHTMYAAVTRFFSNQVNHRVRRVGPVGPLGLCFDTRSGRVSVPLIELVLQGVGGGGEQRWRISPANSVVEVERGVLCLAVVNGGRWLRKGEMVIGAYQLEDNLVRLDLGRSVLGFSNSLLLQRTNCSDLIH